MVPARVPEEVDTKGGVPTEKHNTMSVPVHKGGKLVNIGFSASLVTLHVPSLGLQFRKVDVRLFSPVLPTGRL